MLALTKRPFVPSMILRLVLRLAVCRFARCVASGPWRIMSHQVEALVSSFNVRVESAPLDVAMLKA